MIGGPSEGVLDPLPGFLSPLLVSLFVSQRLIIVLARANKKDFETLRDLLQSGKIKAVIDRTVPLSETGAAIGYVEQGHARGKVVITP